MPARSPEMVLLLTCEHGGNRVPPAYRSLFQGKRKLLQSHRGWDPGALVLARMLERRLRDGFSVALIAATTTRLLIDLNRSATNPHAFSDVVEPLPWSERSRILWHHYLPHLAAVVSAVAEPVLQGTTVVHVGVHTFAPVRNGERRTMDVGLLYDPRRPPERALCDTWKRRLEAASPDLVVRRNAPYRGTSDGLTTILRQRFPAELYLGIELEVNQRFPRRAGPPWTRLQGLLATTLRDALGGISGTNGEQKSARTRRAES